MRMRGWLVTMGAALAVLTAACGTGAEAEPTAASGSQDAAQPQCESMTVAVNEDLPFKAVFYGITSGEVTTDLIGDVQVEFLPIPALIEAGQTGQYDIVQTAVQVIPQLRDQGVPSLMVSPTLLSRGGALQDFAALDSPIQSIEEIPGHTFAVPGFGSSTALYHAIVFQELGIDPSFENGPVQWIDMQYDQALAAAERNQVDAVAAGHYAAWRAMNNENLRFLGNADQLYQELTGAPPILTALVTTAPQVEGRGECFREVGRMVAESDAYARENAEEVAQALIESEQVGDPEDFAEFLPVWLREWYEFGGDASPEFLEATETFWAKGHELGLLPEPPPIEEVLISGEE